jgi:hypothetical protein
MFTYFSGSRAQNVLKMAETRSRKIRDYNSSGKK